jgi:hypothetical protein
MADQVVMGYPDNMSEAQDAVAQAVGNGRMLEEDHGEAPHGEVAERISARRMRSLLPSAEA